MIDRIIQNEERLDKITASIKNLELSLEQFKGTKKDIYWLNRYYGSKNWFKDKEKYENNEISRIKAGVLSEDGVWNMLLNLDELMLNMQKMVDSYFKDKKNNN